MIHVDFTIPTTLVRDVAAIGLTCGLAGFVIFMGAVARQTKGVVLTIALVLMVAGIAGEAIALGLILGGRL